MEMERNTKVSRSLHKNGSQRPLNAHFSLSECTQPHTDQPLRSDSVSSKIAKFTDNLSAAAVAKWHTVAHSRELCHVARSMCATVPDHFGVAWHTGWRVRS